MKLYITQKISSWHERLYTKDKESANQFRVKDEEENDRYYVEDQAFICKKFRICDANHTEIAIIRQKVFSLLPNFCVEIDGRIACRVSRKFYLFRPHYRLDGLSWKLEGDIWAKEYSVTDSGRKVMDLTRRRLSRGDSYELSIYDPGDELLCLCIAIGMNFILESRDSVAKTMARYQE